MCKARVVKLNLCNFITEPPPVTFDYCFKFIGWWLLAALAWAAILVVPFFIIMMILAALGVVR